MNTNYNISLRTAEYKQHDMMAVAARERLARQARAQAPAAQQPATRRSRRAWQLVRQLRTQAQS